MGNREVIESLHLVNLYHVISVEKNIHINDTRPHSRDRMQSFWLTDTSFLYPFPFQSACRHTIDQTETCLFPPYTLHLGNGSGFLHTLLWYRKGMKYPSAMRFYVISKGQYTNVSADSLTMTSLRGNSPILLPKAKKTCIWYETPKVLGNYKIKNI